MYNKLIRTNTMSLFFNKPVRAGLSLPIRRACLSTVATRPNVSVRKLPRRLSAAAYSTKIDSTVDFDPNAVTAMDKQKPPAPGEDFRVAIVGAGNINFGSDEGPWNHSFRLEQYVSR